MTIRKILATGILVIPAIWCLYQGARYFGESESDQTRITTRRATRPGGFRAAPPVGSITPKPALEEIRESIPRVSRIKPARARIPQKQAPSPDRIEFETARILSIHKLEREMERRLAAGDIDGNQVKIPQPVSIELEHEEKLSSDSFQIYIVRSARIDSRPAVSSSMQAALDEMVGSLLSIRSDSKNIPENRRRFRDRILVPMPE